MELFPARKNLSAGIQKKIDEIVKTSSGDAARAAAALRFVQDDIRYMGIEIGRNSHKPADPSKIFMQRFGDCKEKSYLLCCMLNAMNIEASPVFISTTEKKELNNALPAPTAFDHVTVRVKLDGEYYWFDPTIAYQRGSIKDLFYPDYQYGLVISPGTSALTAIPFRQVSYQHIDDYFKVDDYDGKGTLVVTTAFKGSEADDERDNINNESIPELLKSSKKFYAKYYEDIIADSLTYADDEATGILTTKEYYTIPKFWTTNKNDLKKFSFYPFVIENILYRPKEKERKMPVAISFPSSFKEEITIVLPDEWMVTASETHLSNRAFSYNSKFSCVYNQVKLVTDYQTHKDFVGIDESSDYLKDLKEYDDNESYMISSGEDKTSETKQSKKKTDPFTSFFALAILIAVVVGLVRWKKK